ncbi:hypothetical protein [Streptomyces sp. NBC_00893]|uniref:hypothetical protein n=1 Tax=Streptomyces sp. NBC_00893 TaxID=2975862 RepID=UPI002258B25D|nr:hypothetical protein [Streptomyces sp. NBC_00893]MCX4849790.1 hypothetical protein [Streptomyces sp. NBC_00893]
MRSITISRWTAELHRRAIHLTQSPGPNCRDCDGKGGWWETVDGQFVDPVPCRCTEDIRHIRIPLWRRSPADYSTEAPF